MTEFDGRRLAAMFTANATLQVRTGEAAFLYGHFDKLPYARLV